MNLSKYIWQRLQTPQRSAEIAKTVLLQSLITSPTTAPYMRRRVEPLSPKKWVFVVGCYNSGTSLLLQLLGQHPEISIIDEGVFWTNQLSTPEDFGWTRMWAQVADEVRLTESDKDCDSTLIRHDWAYLAKGSKPVVMEKSIVNSARMRWLQANFDNAYFISIVRNGYAVAEGIRRKVAKRGRGFPAQFEDTYPLDLCAQQWVVNNQIIDEDSRYIRQFLPLRYENLCDNPIRVMKSAWDFLELTAPNSSYDEDREWNIHDQKSTIKNMNNSSFERLSIEEIKTIELVAQSMLNEYNYPLLSKVLP